MLTASFKDRAYIEASNGMFLEHPVRAKKKSSILMSEFGFYYHYLKLHHLVLYYAHDGSAKIMSHEQVVMATKRIKVLFVEEELTLEFSRWFFRNVRVISRPNTPIVGSRERQIQ